ncbi:hypothetical protein A5660_03530 [Mycobacterium alsense]|uniref:hypothetical protein n=1 Tax=Mycobacterium alsense TaxID=324058 RepID=UPI0007FEA72D|nr:hypothetical protein [Mycobacterium alsense]OBI99471.1 hypothetical protein A5660_03530 [Mycobacterium alsense]
MANSTTKDDTKDDKVDDKVDDAERETADRDETEAADGAAEDEAQPKRLAKLRFRPKRLWPWVAVALVAAALAGGAFGFVKYRQVSGQLAQLRQERTDSAAAAQLAKDYALKSLTYSFEDPDAFFRSVEDGVCQQLKDKYVNATDLLRGIMLQAQVSSTGEVLATDPTAQPGGAYQVVVSAHQTTRNLQNPTPKVSIILLQVTVNKVGNTFQVCDIGPKTGSHPPVEDQIPAPEPPPAPARPAPKR